MSWAKAVGDRFLDHDHRTSSIPTFAHRDRLARRIAGERASRRQGQVTSLVGFCKPDAQRFSQTRVAGWLKTPGKFSRVRAKAAHFPSALTKKSREQ